MHLSKSSGPALKLMSETIAKLRWRVERSSHVLGRTEAETDPPRGVTFRTEPNCYHGGAFFEAIGVEFKNLEKSREIINADVLDAWFPPAPGVLSALKENLAWIARTSPPTLCEGLIKTISRVRDIDPQCIVPGAGSSALIFLALRRWLSSSSRVLILDPSYGEYRHVLENVVGCKVESFVLRRRNNYQVDLERLVQCFDKQYDLIVLVNPNNPTGQHLPRHRLEQALKFIPDGTRVWLDEAYIEYAGEEESLERFAAASRNVIVCKSMSKVYALSGMRVGYLCAPPHLARELRSITPPWAVALPAQVAAVMALQDPQYYADRYRETHVLRDRLAQDLTALNILEVIPGVANFLLCHVSDECPDAAAITAVCRESGVFIRDASRTSPRLGRQAIRIAVKDAEANQVILRTLAEKSNV